MPTSISPKISRASMDLQPKKSERSLSIYANDHSQSMLQCKNNAACAKGKQAPRRAGGRNHPAPALAFQALAAAISGHPSASLRGLCPQHSRGADEACAAIVAAVAGEREEM